METNTSQHEYDGDGNVATDTVSSPLTPTPDQVALSPPVPSSPGIILGLSASKDWL